MGRTEELTLLAGRYVSLTRAMQAYQAIEDVHVERNREEVFDAAVVVLGDQPDRCTLHRSTCGRVDEKSPPVRAAATGLVHVLFPRTVQASDGAAGPWCLSSEAAAAQLHESLDQQELDLLAAVIRGGSAAVIVAAMPALVAQVRREMSGGEPRCEIPGCLLRSRSTDHSSSPTSP